MHWQELTLIGMFLAALLYIATLYHLAHGRERKAVELGAQIVLDALTRDGRIMATAAPAPAPDQAVNLGDDDGQVEEVDTDGDGLPDVIVARNERAAQQYGERILNDLMKAAEERGKK